MEIRGSKAPKDIPPFDINKLNFNKIIFMADADVDGAHICTLLITLVYKLCPQLIEKGYIYIGETPLYEITYKNGRGKEETFFAFNDAEKDKYLKNKDMKRIKVQRSKGLGENTPEMMWNTSMDPANRRLIRITSEDAQVMREAMSLFMGDDAAPRRQYIAENGHLYMDELDVS